MGILADPIRKITGKKLARRGVNYKLLGLALVGLAIAKLASVYNDINTRMQKTAFNFERCTLHRTMMSPEDIVPVFDGVFVASSDERRKHMMKAVGLEKTQMGGLFAIWNVNAPGEDPSSAPIVLEGFPADVAFRPHGMHFRRETGELFVINHGFAMGGERIDVFKVDEAFPQDPLPEVHPSLREDTPPIATDSNARPSTKTVGQEADAQDSAARAAAIAKGKSEETTPIKLTYSFSVQHKLTASRVGILNDLVLVSDDELYVTQYVAMSLPLGGPAHPANLMEVLRLYGSKLLLATFLARPPIIRCTRIRSEDIECEELARGHAVMHNGIAVSPDGKRILTADSILARMHIFDRSVETGALTLRQKIDLPGSPDNLEIDLHRAARGEEAFIVGMIDPFDYVSFMQKMEGAKNPSDGEDLRMAGGVASLTFDKGSGSYSSSLEMWRMDNLYGISSAAATASEARLLGSAVSDGFMLCRPPECTSDERNERGVCGWRSLDV